MDNIKKLMSGLFMVLILLSAISLIAIYKAQAEMSMVTEGEVTTKTLTALGTVKSTAGVLYGIHFHTDDYNAGELIELEDGEDGDVLLSLPPQTLNTVIALYQADYYFAKGIQFANSIYLQEDLAGTSSIQLIFK